MLIVVPARLTAQQLLTKPSNMETQSLVDESNEKCSGIFVLAIKMVIGGSDRETDILRRRGIDKCDSRIGLAVGKMQHISLF